MIAVITIVETGRRTGIAIPAPFLLLFGSVALAAGLSGLRAGIAAATLCMAFIVYSAAGQFGPSSLTGSILTVVVGSSITYVVAFLIGHARDRVLAVTDDLKATQAELLDARKQLTVKVERSSAELVEVSQELSSVRNRLDSAIEQSPAGVVIIDIDGQVVSANPSMLRMLGLHTMTAANRNLGPFLSQYELYQTDGVRFEFGRGPLTDALETGKVTDHFEFQFVRTDGSFTWFRGSFGPIMADDNTVSGAMVILLDITEEKYAADARHELSRRLMQVQEDERASLAYELHDEIGQYLAALNMNLYALKTGPDNPAIIAACISMVGELSKTVRSLAVELRPAMLDDLGLISALNWYLARQRERTGQNIMLEAKTVLGELPAKLKTASFRVVQEAVSNAINHAKCTTISVRIFIEGDSLCVVITDDGCGFDTHKRASGKVVDLRLGLLSMRERTSVLDGSLTIESEIDLGTTITARFPLH